MRCTTARRVIHVCALHNKIVCVDTLVIPRASWYLLRHNQGSASPLYHGGIAALDEPNH